MGGWGDGEMGSVEEIKKYISSPLPCRTTLFLNRSQIGSIGMLHTTSLLLSIARSAGMVTVLFRGQNPTPP